MASESIEQKMDDLNVDKPSTSQSAEPTSEQAKLDKEKKEQKKAEKAAKAAKHNQDKGQGKQGQGKQGQGKQGAKQGQG